MSDREALAAALETWEEIGEDPTCPCGSTDHAIHLAARERLAQLPEDCGTCDGSGIAPDNDTAELGSGVFSYRHCPSCHGSGKVYPAELVERIAAVFDNSQDISRRFAVAVLDALNGETE